MSGRPAKHFRLQMAEDDRQIDVRPPRDVLADRRAAIQNDRHEVAAVQLLDILDEFGKDSFHATLTPNSRKPSHRQGRQGRDTAGCS